MPEFKARVDTHTNGLKVRSFILSISIFSCDIGHSSTDIMVGTTILKSSKLKYCFYIICSFET